MGLQYADQGPRRPGDAHQVELSTSWRGAITRERGSESHDEREKNPIDESQDQSATQYQVDVTKIDRYCLFVGFRQQGRQRCQQGTNIFVRLSSSCSFSVCVHIRPTPGSTGKGDPGLPSQEDELMTKSLNAWAVWSDSSSVQSLYCARLSGPDLSKWPNGNFAPLERAPYCSFLQHIQMMGANQTIWEQKT